MKMLIKTSHKIKLNPTEEQAAYFWRCAGVARFAFYWGLAEYNKILDLNRECPDERIPVSGRRIKVEFNKVKPDFVKEVSTWAYQGAFDDLQSAFKKYWDKCKKGDNKAPRGTKPRKDGRPHGWPRFKNRDKSIPSFYQANTDIKFNGYNVTLPIIGVINMAEPLRFDGRVLGARVSYTANSWWLSVQVETEYTPKPVSGEVGIDFGIKYLAVTSDGEVFDNPKPLVTAEKKLRRLQRKLDRQRRANNPDNYNDDKTVKTGAKTWLKSKNYIETEKAIAKLHYHISCIRQEAAHKMTSSIANQYELVGVENLNINGMLKNRHLSKALNDAALYEKRRQLEYKVKRNGGLVVPISTWFPSSKMCSNCGEINANLKLSDREWTCDNCGTTHHRDGNAAINIRNEAMRIVAGLPNGDIKRLDVNT